MFSVTMLLTKIDSTRNFLNLPSNMFVEYGESEVENNTVCIIANSFFICRSDYCKD